MCLHPESSTAISLALPCLGSNIRCSTSHGNMQEAGCWQSRAGKPKAALTSSGRGDEAQQQPRLVFSLRSALLRAYLGGSALSWLLRSSLLMTCVMSTVVAASLALASSSRCLRMMGLGLERRVRRPNRKGELGREEATGGY